MVWAVLIESDYSPILREWQLESDRSICTHTFLCGPWNLNIVYMQVIKHGRTASRQEVDQGVELGAKAVFDRLEEELHGVCMEGLLFKFQF